MLSSALAVVGVSDLGAPCACCFPRPVAAPTPPRLQSQTHPQAQLGHPLFQPQASPYGPEFACCHVGLALDDLWTDESVLGSRVPGLEACFLY